MVKLLRKNKIVAPTPAGAGKKQAAEPERPGLHWQMDPDESLSDWTIEILAAGKVHGCYHVHKAIVAVGAKKSQYFYQLIRSDNFQESKTNTSRIELEPLAAEAFPVLLDYQYSWSDELQITDENAAALRYLAEYLGIHHLRDRAERFQIDNLDFTNCVMYYSHAKLFHDESIIQLIAKVCCNMLDAVELDSPLLEIPDEKLWVAILKENLGKECPHLSNIVLKFCTLHPECVNAETFSSLTEESVMPVVALEAAMPLMKLEMANRTPDEAIKLTSLQKRCVTALALSWKHLNTPNLEKDLAKLNPLVASYALTQAIENAKAELLKVGESILPEAIFVSGAGTESVNGLYVRTECYGPDGAPRFAKSGMWHGNPFRYDLCCCLMLSGKMSWFISIQDSVAPGTCNDIDFYQAKSTAEGNPKLPPTRNWTAATYGEEPTPTIEFRFVDGTFEMGD